MESNDNGTLPEVQIRKPHFSATGTSLRKPRQEIRGKVMSSQKSGSSGSRPVPESEHKKAGSKTPASRERTQIPEDHLLRRTVVTTGFPRSGLVGKSACPVRFGENGSHRKVSPTLPSCRENLDADRGSIAAAGIRRFVSGKNRLIYVGSPGCGVCKDDWK